jgi:hypothetical protein
MSDNDNLLFLGGQAHQSFQTMKLLPHPHLFVNFGFEKMNLEDNGSSS